MSNNDFDYYWQSLRQKVALLNEYERNKNLLTLAWETALQADGTTAWRAVWFLNQLKPKEIENDFYNYLPQLCEKLKIKNPSLQRELLRLFKSFTIDERCEAYIFDEAQKIWENLGNISSTRVQAFFMMVQIANKYPELKEELSYYNEDSYVKDLSPGIKRQVQRKLNSL